MASSGGKLPKQRDRTPIPSTLVRRSVVVGGHRTSVRLEAVMFEALHDIAGQQGITVRDLVTEIDRERTASSLTEAIRVYIVDYYRTVADHRNLPLHVAQYAADKAGAQVRASEAAALGSPMIATSGAAERVIQSPVTKPTTFARSQVRRVVRAVIAEQHKSK